MATAEPTADEISRVVNNLRIRKRRREASGMHVIADCPTCNKESHLYVNEETGNYDCKKCGIAGAIWSLATALGMRLREKRSSIVSNSHVAEKIVGMRKRVRDAMLGGYVITTDDITNACEQLFDEQNTNARKVHAYLQARGFEDETIRRFKLCKMVLRPKEGPPQLGVGIPYLEDGRIPLVKLRNLETKDKRMFMRTPGSHSGLFNVEAIKDCTQVVLVEGELDAVSMWQLGIPNCVSTSLGAKKNIPDEWVRALSDADDIVLFYDDDDQGDEAVSSLVGKLGVHRCRIARIPEKVSEIAKEKLNGDAPKDANDLLRAQIPGEWVKAIIADATAITSMNLKTQSAYADMLTKEIRKAKESLGIKVPYDNLNELLRGVRLGEVTVVTGHTGSGKTTFLGALLEKIAAGGNPVLNMSMENGPESIVRKSFQRKLGRPISSLDSEADKELAMSVLQRLDEHPVYLLGVPRGRQLLSFLCDEIRFARFRFGVRYVCVDHLHYLQREERDDERQFLDTAISTLTALAAELELHIFLVVHPRGGIEESTIPSHETVKGTSAVKQDVDNSITVFRRKEFDGKGKKLVLKYPSGTKTEIEMKGTTAMVWLSKKRHDEAREGTCFFDFNPRTLTYTEVTKDSLIATGGASTSDAQRHHDPFED